MSAFSYCGVDCNSCAVFQASQNKDMAHKQWLAAEYSMEGFSVTPEQLNCGGCKAQNPSSQICQQCEIRACASNRDRQTCADCQNYPCNLINRYVPVDTDARNQLDYLHVSLFV